jgi:hypothetical protein
MRCSPRAAARNRTLWPRRYARSVGRAKGAWLQRITLRASQIRKHTACPEQWSNEHPAFRGILDSKVRRRGGATTSSRDERNPGNAYGAMRSVSVSV